MQDLYNNSKGNIQKAIKSSEEYAIERKTLKNI
jgi:hypothetical protein